MSVKSIYKNRNKVIQLNGLAKSYKEYLRSDLWKKIRARVLKRDRGECRICGGIASQAHHTNYATKTMLGHSIVGIFAICSGCHYFVEFFGDGTKGHLFLDVRARIKMLARSKGREFVWPADEKRPCVTCRREVGLASLDDNEVCRRCRHV